MSPEFEELNREDLDVAEYEQRMDPLRFHPENHIGEGLQLLGQGIGYGIAWAGFWIGLGAVQVAYALRFAS